jgi:hypothetical protein
MQNTSAHTQKKKIFFWRKIRKKKRKMIRLLLLYVLQLTNRGKINGLWFGFKIISAVSFVAKILDNICFHRSWA